MITSFIIIGITLFVLAYFSKRRFGLLGLALVAGTIVSSNWATSVTSMLQTQGVSLSFPPLSLVVAGFLIVLPAILLLLVGPTYHKKWQRLLGSALFALFATIFIIIMVNHEAPILIADITFVEFTVNTQAISLVLVVVLSLADIIASHLPKKKKAHG